jgi:acetate---CoA ligase (ADP-forming)
MPRDLQPLFDPRSVAILGASNDPAKWGNWLARGALKGKHRRPVYLINRNGGEVLGEPAYRSLAELPCDPELVVIAVPAPAFEQAVDDSLARNARALIGITAGLGEAGDEEKRRERELVWRIREAGAMLLGPNCLGVFDASSDLGLASNEFPPGRIGLISQSGNLALELGLLSRRYELGFSRFASIGNQADLSVAELVASCAAHDETDLIALYVEDFGDGRAFVDAAASAGKPCVLITTGRSDAGERAAASHTGAMVTRHGVVAAACRAAGISLVSTPAEMIDLAQALLSPRRLSGSRVAVLADGGGHGAIASDVAVAAGLDVPKLEDDLQESLKRHLPETASTKNPVDLAGGGEEDFYNYSRMARELLESNEVDGLLMTGYFGGYSQYSEEFSERETDVARVIARAVEETGKPLVAQSMYPDLEPNRVLREHGIPVYLTIEAAASAMAALRMPPAPDGAPPLPEPQTEPFEPSYFGARELLAAAGVPFVEAIRVSTAQEALAAADGIGYPVVLKALGTLHKSDAGGVRLGITDAQSFAQAFDDMTARLAPPEFSVEAMVRASLTEGAELIIGAKRDSAFGPVAMVGMGGVYTELLADLAEALAPVTQEQAVELIQSLHGAALLRGARGRSPLSIPAAAAALVSLSRVAAARPEIAEIEVNPLLVTPHGALALDARIIHGDRGGDDAG